MYIKIDNMSQYKDYGMTKRKKLFRQVGFIGLSKLKSSEI